MREVWRSGALQGHRLAPATVSGATYTVFTSWRPNEVIDTKGWPPGAYLLRLNASTGSRMIQAITVRLLRAMADGPMGRVHPARSNLAALHAYRGDPIAAHAAAG